MQKISRKNVEKSSKTKEEPTSSKTVHEDEKKYTRSITTISTPRNYAQKSSTTDIYGQKKVQAQRAPKKVGSTTSTKTSPMSSLLKSSSSTSIKSHREKPKIIDSSKKVSQSTVKTSLQKAKNLPITNVTVNSPLTRRKFELKGEDSIVNSNRITSKNTPIQKSRVAEKRSEAPKVIEHRRQKTRTLTDEEVKVLTPDGVDNNVHMKNLLKLNAKPKSFFVDLDENKQAKPASPAGSEVSYEDDFESYESDFESYHSDRTGSGENINSSDENRSGSDSEARTDSCENSDVSEKETVEKREGKDEERMLDSGNFDLERRSATRPSMADIMETTESPDADQKKFSLPDEGFQDMSSSSGVRSHVEVFERTLFIDFDKSKTMKKKLMLSKKMQQRAKDILSMVKLHEMTYSLFEMQPIPYDVYMATFGRQNYTQTSSQTFHDGICEEVQTDEIFSQTKWTQHPVKFSNSEHIYNESNTKKVNDEDFLQKFTFIFESGKQETKNEKDINSNHKNNPLKIYFEQRDGVGSDKMMPSNVFEEKLTKSEHNGEKLKKFLKKSERLISNILSKNANNTITGLKKSNLTFSKGFSTLFEKSDTNKLFQSKPVTCIVVSKQKSHFLLTIHSNEDTKTPLICLWDITMTTREPLKILTAIDEIVISIFNGKSDGIFVSILKDSSVHLWDLSEHPTIVQTFLKPKAVDVNTEGLCQSEIDREWNLRNSHIDEELILPLLHASAYTSSAVATESSDDLDAIVGVDFVDDKVYRQDGGRRIVGQICTLQRNGVLTTWLIVQDKQNKSPDLGKAFWSKTKLEKNFQINVTDYIDSIVLESKVDFNLSAAKKRLAVKRNAKISRTKSGAKTERPLTARSRKRVVVENWESGVLCSDVKVVNVEREDCFLIAKNCGEVLCCRRVVGNVKVQRFGITNDKSTITQLETPSNSLPYFLAATDSGTIHLYSIAENRVILTLDCRNINQDTPEKFRGDPKGRYLGTVPVKPVEFEKSVDVSKQKITSISWSPSNPCRIIARTDSCVATWDLTRSDIYAEAIRRCGAITFTGDGDVILLSGEGEVEIHRQIGEEAVLNMDLFKKYVALL